jgi:hypothetical protein
VQHQQQQTKAKSLLLLLLHRQLKQLLRSQQPSHSGSKAAHQQQIRQAQLQLQRAGGQDLLLRSHSVQHLLLLPQEQQQPHLVLLPQLLAGSTSVLVLALHQE